MFTCKCPLAAAFARWRGLFVFISFNILRMAWTRILGLCSLCIPCRQNCHLYIRHTGDVNVTLSFNSILSLLNQFLLSFRIEFNQLHLQFSRSFFVSSIWNLQFKNIILDNSQHCFKFKSKDLQSGRLILIFLTASTFHSGNNEKRTISYYKSSKGNSSVILRMDNKHKGPGLWSWNRYQNWDFFLEIEWISE